MRLKSLLMIFLLILLLVSCKTESSTLKYSAGESVITYSSNATDEAEGEISKSEDLDIQDGIDYLSETRDLNNLNDITVYWNENDLNINYYFSEEARKSDS